MISKNNNYLIMKGWYGDVDGFLTFKPYKSLPTLTNCYKEIYFQVLFGIEKQIEYANDYGAISHLPLYEFFPIVNYEIWTSRGSGEYVKDDDVNNMITDINGDKMDELFNYLYNKKLTMPYWGNIIEQETGRQLYHSDTWQLY